MIHFITGFKQRGDDDEKLRCDVAPTGGDGRPLKSYLNFCGGCQSVKYEVIIAGLEFKGLTFKKNGHDLFTR